MSLDPRALPEFDVVVREVEECVRQALEQIIGKESAGNCQGCAADADDGSDEMFVDTMSGINVEDAAESEGFRFADALSRANLSVETTAAVVINTSKLLAFRSSFFILQSFRCRNISVAIHFFQKLVYRARLYMEKASLSYCVSVLDSSGERSVIQELLVLLLRGVPESNLRPRPLHRVTTVQAPQ